MSQGDAHFSLLQLLPLSLCLIPYNWNKTWDPHYKTMSVSIITKNFVLEISEKALQSTLRTLLLVLAGTKPQKPFKIKWLNFLQTSDMLPIACATVILRISYFHATRYRTAARNLWTSKSFGVAIGVGTVATA
jgi:hypothetical protein